MASGGAEDDDGGTSLDIDNVHMLLQGQSISALCEMLQHALSQRDTLSSRGDLLSLVHHFDAFRNMSTAAILMMFLKALFASCTMCKQFQDLGWTG